MAWLLVVVAGIFETGFAVPWRSDVADAG